jgi:hypothetical protein
MKKQHKQYYRRIHKKTAMKMLEDLINAGRIEDVDDDTGLYNEFKRILRKFKVQII